MVWIYTGWSEHWRDPAGDSPYYAMAPGLAVDAADYLGSRRVVAVGLDTPFIDPVPNGMLQGKAEPPAGTSPGLPFGVHHQLLTQYGIHHLENLKLDGLAQRAGLDVLRHGPAHARQGQRRRGGAAGRHRSAGPEMSSVGP